MCHSRPNKFLILKYKANIFHGFFYYQVVGTISGDDHPVQAVEVMESRKLLTCGTSSNLLRNATIDEIEV